MKKMALCIGINDYPGTQMDLGGCVNDASDWSDTLQSRGFKVSTMVDAAATRKAMADAMASLLGKLKKGDRAVITFSGHGTYLPDQNGDESDAFDEGLCGHDIVNAGPLLDDEIRAIFAARKPGVQLLLISDSCHSGTVTRAAPADPAADGSRPRFMPMGNWMPRQSLPLAANGQVLRIVQPQRLTTPLAAAISRASGDLLLAGCKEGPNNFSYDAIINGRPCGAFTYYALKTLKTLKPGDTYDIWHRAIGDYLPSASYPQSPQLFGSATAQKRVIFE